MLDYGGGTGIFSELAAQQAATVICVDRSFSMIDFGQTHRLQNLDLLADSGFARAAGTVRRIACEDQALGQGLDSFDVVLVIAVLGYVDACVRVVGRLGALLRPEGLLPATVPEPRSPVRWA